MAIVEDYEDGADYTGSHTSGSATLAANNTDYPHFKSSYMQYCTLDAADSNQYAMYYHNISGLGSTVYMIAHRVRFDQLCTSGEDVRVLNFGQYTTYNGIAYFGIAYNSGDSSVEFFCQYHAGGSFNTTYSGIDADADRNYTIEVQIVQSSTVGAVRMWVDGVLVIEQTGLNNSTRTLGYAWIGFAYSDGPNAVWIDNVEISASRIGNLPYWTGFQDGTSGDLHGTETYAGDSLDVIATDPYWGSNHAESDLAGDGSSKAEGKVYLSPTVTEVYARAYFQWKTQLPSNENNSIFDIVGTTNNNVARVTFIDVGGTKYLRVYYEDAGAQTEDYTWSGVALNTYYCIEVRVLVNNGAGEVEVWINGSKVIDLSGLDNDAYGNIDEIQVGTTYGTISGAYEVYWDDFWVSDSYIGADTTDHNVSITDKITHGEPENTEDGFDLIVKAYPAYITTSNEPYPILGSQHRYLFRSMGLWWVFYCDGNDHDYRTSSDGRFWSAATEVVGAAEGQDVCYWVERRPSEDGDKIHWVRESTGYGNGNEPTYRRGTLNSDGSIDWDAAVQDIVSPQAANQYHWIPGICVDSNGKAWVIFRLEDTGAGTNTIAAYRNGNTDGTWSTDVSNTDVHGASVGYRPSIIPLKDGKVLALYSYGSHPMRVRCYNGSSWENEVDSALDSSGTYQHSGIGDQNDKYGHIIFQEFLTWDLQYTRYDPDTNTLSAEEEIADLGAATACPISQAGGMLVATYVQESTDALYMSVSQVGSGSWSAPVIIHQEVDSISSQDYFCTMTPDADYEDNVGIMYITSRNTNTLKFERYKPRTALLLSQAISHGDSVSAELDTSQTYSKTPTDAFNLSDLLLRQRTRNTPLKDAFNISDLLYRQSTVKKILKDGYKIATKEKDGIGVWDLVDLRYFREDFDNPGDFSKWSGSQTGGGDDEVSITTEQFAMYGGKMLQSDDNKILETYVDDTEAYIYKIIPNRSHLKISFYMIPYDDNDSMNSVDEYLWYFRIVDALGQTVAGLKATGAAESGLDSLWVVCSENEVEFDSVLSDGYGDIYFVEMDIQYNYPGENSVTARIYQQSPAWDEDETKTATDTYTHNGPFEVRLGVEVIAGNWFGWAYYDNFSLNTVKVIDLLLPCLSMEKNGIQLSESIFKQSTFNRFYNDKHELAESDQDIDNEMLEVYLNREISRPTTIPDSDLTFWDLQNIDINCTFESSAEVVRTGATAYKSEIVVAQDQALTVKDVIKQGHWIQRLKLYVYIDDNVINNAFNGMLDWFIAFAQAQAGWGSFSNTMQLGLGKDATGFFWFLYEADQTGDTNYDSAIQAGRWFELELLADTENSIAYAYIDGGRVALSLALNASTPVERVRIGQRYINGAAQGTSTVYLDDVIITYNYREIDLNLIDDRYDGFVGLSLGDPLVRQSTYNRFYNDKLSLADYRAFGYYKHLYDPLRISDAIVLRRDPVLRFTDGLKLYDNDYHQHIYNKFLTDALEHYGVAEFYWIRTYLKSITEGLHVVDGSTYDRLWLDPVSSSKLFVAHLRRELVDGFEDNGLNKWASTSVGAGDSVTVVEDGNQRSGTKCVRLTVDDSGQDWADLYYDLENRGATRFRFRGHLKMDALPAVGEHNQVFILEAYSAAELEGLVNIFIENDAVNGLQWAISSVDYPAYDYEIPDSEMAADRYFELEVIFYDAGASGFYYRVIIDGGRLDTGLTLEPTEIGSLICFMIMGDAMYVCNTYWDDIWVDWDDRNINLDPVTTENLGAYLELSDTITQQKDILKYIYDSLEHYDTLDYNRAIQRTLTDGYDLWSQPYLQRTLNRALFDYLEHWDQEYLDTRKIIYKWLYDYLDLYETDYHQHIFNKYLEDNFEHYDEINLESAINRYFTDGIEHWDSASLQRIRNIALADYLEHHDELSSVYRTYLSLTDSVHVSDLLTRQSTWNKYIEDGYDLYDILLQKEQATINLSDSYELSEALTQLRVFNKYLEDHYEVSDDISLLSGLYVTILDYYNLSDDFSKNLIRNITLTDGYDFYELLEWASERKIQLSDALELADYLSLKSSLIVELFDYFELSDTIYRQATWNKYIEDGYSLYDIIQLQQALHVLVEENYELWGSLTRQSTWNKLITDAYNHRDYLEQTGALSRYLYDYHQVSDTLTKQLDYNKQLTETYQLSDYLKKTRAINRDLLDGLEHYDTLQYNYEIAIAVSDALSLADMIYSNVGQDINVYQTDGFQLADTLNRSLLRMLDIIDNYDLSDDTAINRMIKRIINEAYEIWEALETILQKNRQIRDAYLLQDLLETQWTKYMFLLDELRYADYLSRTGAAGVYLADYYNLSDTLSKQFNRYVGLSEAFEIYDSLAVLRELNRNIIDNLKHNDSINKVLLWKILQTDGYTLADSAAFSFIRNKLLIDSIQYTDTIYKQMTVNKLLTELYYISDQITVHKQAIKYLNLVDGLQLYDNLSYSTQFVRSLAIADGYYYSDDTAYARTLNRALNDALKLSDALTSYLGARTINVTLVDAYYLAEKWVTPLVILQDMYGLEHTDIAQYLTYLETGWMPARFPKKFKRIT